VCGAHPIKLILTWLFLDGDRAIMGKSQKRIDNYGRLIDFLSQISKMPYFSLLNLADFLMHD